MALALYKEQGPFLIGGWRPADLRSMRKRRLQGDKGRQWIRREGDASPPLSPPESTHLLAAQSDHGESGQNNREQHQRPLTQ